VLSIARAVLVQHSQLLDIAEPTRNCSLSLSLFLIPAVCVVCVPLDICRYSDWVSEAVSTQGQAATTHHHVRSMRAVRKDILKLIGAHTEPAMQSILCVGAASAAKA
jgi:hypothetical protein